MVEPMATVEPLAGLATFDVMHAADPAAALAAACAGDAEAAAAAAASAELVEAVRAGDALAFTAAVARWCDAVLGDHAGWALWLFRGELRLLRNQRNQRSRTPRRRSRRCQRHRLTR